MSNEPLLQYKINKLHHYSLPKCILDTTQLNTVLKIKMYFVFYRHCMLPNKCKHEFKYETHRVQTALNKINKLTRNLVKTEFI